MAKFALIPAPGHTGNVARIVSVHASLAAARKARGASKTIAIIEAGESAHKGQTVYMDTLRGHRYDTDGVLRA